jgi:hypothetical protein
MNVHKIGTPEVVVTGSGNHSGLGDHQRAQQDQRFGGNDRA